MSHLKDYMNEYCNLRNSYPHQKGESYLCLIYRTIKSMMACLCVIILSSCGNNTSDGVFKSSTDAFDAYEEFSSELASSDSLSFGEIVGRISQWQDLRGVVFPIISNDTTNISHRSLLLNLEQTDKYIKFNVSRLVGMVRMTFTDLVDLKVKISPSVDGRMVATLNEANDFYSKFDSTELYEGSFQSLLTNYKSFLAVSIEDGISNKRAMLDFIRKEDFYFRSFLKHLNNSNNFDITDISHLTEEVCMQVYQSTEEGLIPYDDAVVFLSKRNTRRMLQNATACVDDISEGKVSNIEQATSYLWMLLQPYILIEPFDCSLMSDEEQKSFMKVADSMPMVLSNLNVHLKLEPTIIESMPNNITQSLIDTF